MSNWKKFCKDIGLNPDECEYVKSISTIRNPLFVGWVTDSPEVLDAQRKRIEYLRKRKEDLWQGKKHLEYIFLHERPYRVQLLLEVLGLRKNQMTKTELGECIREVWIDSESPSVNVDFWSSLFLDIGDHVMSEEDREVFDSLPNEVTIYRGIQNPKDRGMSWTLDKEVAQFFASRWNPQYQEVKEVTVPKSEVICFLGGRGEREIIYVKDE